MPKQTFEYYDYLGPLVVALIFALVVLILSFFLLNFLLVSKHDELTVFERFGSRHNLRLGPHRLDSIRRINEHKAAIEAAEKEGLENKHDQCPIITIPKVNVEGASIS
uniref:Uncharacterized protein n=1 Tax=Panagrolaimus sp. PS1159 TaxID=55785 RepID=A0AC35GHC9_9BILA